MYLIAKKSCYEFAFLATCAGVLLTGVDARAVLVNIEYWDRANVNQDFAGGPLWTGFVDTAADTLTIETWQELPLHGADYWIPRQIPDTPLVWRAMGPSIQPSNANGEFDQFVPYDVPDSFDGNIDNSFAFISEQHLRQMEWKRAVFADPQPPVPPDHPPNEPFPPVVDHYEDVEYTLDTGNVWPGWGGFALQEPVNGVVMIVFHTAQPKANQPAFDETIMPALPVKHDGDEHPTYVASSDAIITAEILEPSVPIPEPRPWLAIPAALLAAVVLRWFAQRRREVVMQTVDVH
jgi:hypothetical protein